jgi:hypothetical protein
MEEAHVVAALVIPSVVEESFAEGSLLTMADTIIRRLTARDTRLSSFRYYDRDTNFNPFARNRDERGGDVDA